MKIRKAIRMAALGGVALALPHVTVAGNLAGSKPTALSGAWQLDASGNIVLDACPTGYTCSSASVTDTGFLQRQVTDGTTTFIQTIVAEGASGDRFSNYTNSSSFFGDDSFVALNASEGGLFGRQRISDKSAPGDFTAQANFNTGAFMMMEDQSGVEAGFDGAANPDGNGSMVELGQQIVDASNEFAANFGFDHGMGMTSMFSTDPNNKAKFVNLSLTSYANDTAGGFDGNFALNRINFEGATLSTAAENLEQKSLDIESNLSGAATEGITQNFAVRERMGPALVGGGTWVWDDGITTAYAAGDAIKRTTVGQIVDGAGEFGFTEAFSNSIADVVDGKATTSIRAGGVYSLVDSTVPFVNITDDSQGGGDGDPFTP